MRSSAPGRRSPVCGQPEAGKEWAGHARCAPDDRDAIDTAVVGGVPYHDIAKRHEGVSISAISRHRKDQHQPSVGVTGDGRNTTHSLDMLGQLHDLHARVLRILEGAERTGKRRPRWRRYAKPAACWS